MLNLLKNLLADEQDADHDFYVDFLDPDAPNTLFQELYLQDLRKYLRLIARA